jgi:hypothetical protein
MSKNLISRNVNCTICGGNAKLTKTSNSLNSYVWICRSQKLLSQHVFKRSVTKSSFFEKSKIPLKVILVLINEWIFECSVKNTIQKNKLI